jgi:hypothetical protein
MSDACEVFHTELPPPKRMPKIVCLCGSTRFKDAFEEANYRETMVGRIVLSVGFFMHASGNKHGESIGATPEQKIALDELHKRKIDLCDEVLVLNVGGYIGASTRSEIDYAIAHGKPVRYQEPDAFGPTPITVGELDSSFGPLAERSLLYIKMLKKALQLERENTELRQQLAKANIQVEMEKMAYIGADQRAKKAEQDRDFYLHGGERTRVLEAEREAAMWKQNYEDLRAAVEAAMKATEAKNDRS